MVWSEVFVNLCISMEKSCNEQFVNVFSNQKKQFITVSYTMYLNRKSGHSLFVNLTKRTRKKKLEKNDNERFITFSLKLF